MKNSTMIFIGVIAILAVFTTLFFVKPRIVIQENIVEKIIEKVPENIEIGFESEKPDTVYDAIIVDEDGTQALLVASKKTFREELLGKDDEPLVKVESEIIAYAPTAVSLFEHSIDISINKDALANELRDDVNTTIRRSYRKGLLYGAGATVIVAGIVFMFAK